MYEDNTPGKPVSGRVIESTLTGKTKRNSKMTIWHEKCSGISRTDFEEVLRNSFEMFMEGEGLKDLAVTYPMVPLTVFRSIAREFDWDRQRRDHLEQLKTAVDIDYVQTVLKNRSATAQQLVNTISPTIQVFMDKVQQAMDRDDTVGLRRIAESFGQVAGVLMKAAGVDAAPLLAAELNKAREEEGRQGKVPWSINASGPVTIVREQEKEGPKPVIDVDET